MESWFLAAIVLLVGAPGDWFIWGKEVDVEYRETISDRLVASASIFC